MQPENYQTNPDPQQPNYAHSYHQPQPQPQPQIAPQPVIHQPHSTFYTSNPFLVGLNSLISTLKINPVPVMLTPIVMLGVVAVVIIIAIVAGLTRSTAGGLIAVIITLISYILFVPWMLSTYYGIAAHSMADRMLSTKNAVQSGLNKALPMLGLMILMMIITALGLIVFILPGVYIFARISLAPATLVTENLGPVAAIKRSFNLTKGHAIEMLAALLAGGIFGTNGILAPYFGVTQLFGRYQDLRNLQSSQVSKPKVHWLNYAVTFCVPVLIAIIVALVMVSSGTLMYKNSKQNDPPEQLFNDPIDMDSSSSINYKYDY